jgi:hypothetical protein
MQLGPVQTPPRSTNLATPDFLVMNGMARGGRSIAKEVGDVCLNSFVHFVLNLCA